jgi:tetratricopeptide (TPR) repeat protein
MTPAPASASSRPARWDRLASWAAPFVVVLAVYYGALRAPFVFDDRPAIERNESIRRLWPLTVPLSPPVTAAGATGRPITNLSLALDHAAHGLDPRGYHLTNLLLHGLAGALLWQLLRRALAKTSLAPQRETVAAGATLLWLLHPLQTETVVCVIQRNEILVAISLLAVLLALERAASPRPRGAVLIAAIAALAGVASKEVMAVAPMLTLLYDRTFLAGSFAAAWQRRRGFHLSVAAAWLPLAAFVAGHGQRAGTAGFGLGTSAWDYLVMQCAALATYARLVLWPHPLVLDYGPNLTTSLAAVMPEALLVLLLLAGTVVALRIRPTVGFAAAAVFTLLAPSSSFIPLTTQPIAEHRMYLPLAALAALAAAAAVRLPSRLARPALAVGAIALGLTTLTRVGHYASEESIWRDTVAKRPDNARAHASLAGVLARTGRLPEALTHFATAVSLQPDYADARNDYGAALGQAGRDLDALAEHAAAVRLKPDDPTLRLNLALALLRLDRPAEARPHLERLLSHEPRFAAALAALGQAALLEARFPEAIRHLNAARELQPRDALTAFHLGLAWQGQSGDPAALPYLQEAATLAPERAEIRLACASALQAAGQREAAAEHYAAAVRLRPDAPEISYNLGALLLDLGRAEAASLAFKAAVSTRPDWIPARHNLALALMRLDRPAEAATHYAEIARLEPSAVTLHNLALALAAAGHTADAIAADDRALQLDPGFNPARRHRQELLRGAGPR